jgi:hypothetical protein
VSAFEFVSTDRAALTIAALLDGMMTPIHPAALRVWFRGRIRVALGAAVNAGLVEEVVADEFAAAISEGADQ